TEFYFHELRRNGGDIQLRCLNHSDYMTNIHGNKVYVGLIHLQGLEERFARQIVIERKKSGEYKDLQDIFQRLHPSLVQLNLLIRIGALRFTGLDKKTLLWEANFKSKRVEKEVPVSLFATADEPHFNLPSFEEDRLEDLKDEVDLLGFVVGDFFELLEEKHL